MHVNRHVVDREHERATAPVRHLWSTFQSGRGEPDSGRGPGSVGDGGSRSVRRFERTRQFRQAIAKNQAYGYGEFVTLSYFREPFGTV